MSRGSCRVLEGRTSPDPALALSIASAARLFVVLGRSQKQPFPALTLADARADDNSARLQTCFALKN
jgi:hypothetical protein